jgi:glycosyltransferase involved in cell wall biosynthesis
MRKIKLLYGLEAVGGGALKHLVYLVSRLDNNIFDITVILSNSREENTKEEIDKMKAIGAKVLFFPMCRNINPIKDVLAFLQLLLFVYKGNFDIVHAHSSKAGALFRCAAWLCRVPFICYTPHCFYFQGKTGLKKVVFLAFEKLLAKITSCIIVSESEQNEIVKTKLASTSKIVNINNAIDFDEYQQNKEISNTRAVYGIKPNTFVVGAIGRLEPQKDWKTFIYAANEVLKKHPETIFLIVGDGKLFGEIQELVIKLNLEDNILLIGYIKEIYKIYGLIDIFVNTSLWEGLPYVFLEAMNYKKAIIATDTGNDTTVLDDETGYITPVRDHKSIAHKIINLIENKQVAIQMGQKGGEKLLQKFSFEYFIQQHEMLYRNGVQSKTVNFNDYEV